MFGRGAIEVNMSAIIYSVPHERKRGNNMTNQKEKTANMEVRNALHKTHTPLWKVADVLGIHEITLCRRLRHELPADEKREILNAIKSINK